MKESKPFCETTIQWKLLKSIQKLTPITKKVMDWVERFPKHETGKIVETNKYENKNNISVAKNNSRYRRTLRRKQEREQNTSRSFEKGDTSNISDTNSDNVGARSETTAISPARHYVNLPKTGGGEQE